MSSCRQVILFFRKNLPNLAGIQVHWRMYQSINTSATLVVDSLLASKRPVGGTSTGIDPVPGIGIATIVRGNDDNGVVILKSK